MTDFKLQYSDGAIDVAFENDDIGQDDGLGTAILISLFSDKAVTTEELPPEETDRRGWWGDRLAETDGDEIGSKLWLLARQKPTLEVIELAREYSLEALQWLIDDRVASDVTVIVERLGLEMLAIEVVVERPTGEAGRFKFVWDPHAAALAA